MPAKKHPVKRFYSLDGVIASGIVSVLKAAGEHEMSATITFEVECEVSGTVQPAEPDVGIFSAYVEDAGADTLSALVVSRVGGKTTWKPVDILAGLDDAARRIVLANISEIYAEEVSEAVMSEVAA